MQAQLVCSEIQAGPATELIKWVSAVSVPALVNFCHYQLKRSKGTQLIVYMSPVCKCC